MGIDIVSGWVTANPRGCANLQRDTRGEPRADERRVTTRIEHVLKSGGRRADAFYIHGHCRTVCNGFVCWAGKAMWLDIFHAVPP
jgi:hypothetical protein